MIWIDYALLVVLGLSAVVGLLRGFVKEALSLLVWVLAVWCAWKYAGLAAPMLQGLVAEPVLRQWAARAVVLVGVLLIGGLGTWLLCYVLDRTGLTGTDRLLGGVFGLARGAVLAGLLVIILQFAGFDESPWWSQSRLIPYANPIVGQLKDAAARSVDMIDRLDDQG